MAIEMTSHTITEKIYTDLRPRIEALSELNHSPTLAIILVGHDSNSETYVAIKKKRAEELGIGFSLHRLDAAVDEDKILHVIDKLNNEPSVSGIIVQLPLPQHIDTDRILRAVKPEKDVDALGNNSPFMPPTVRSILRLLEEYDIILKDKRIVIVGKGRLVGQPLLDEFKALHLNVTACDETTDDLVGCTIGADILISATGEKHVIQPSMVSDGAVIIDVDCDVDYDRIFNKVSYITPQKGAVGPLTVAFLLSNVVEAADQQASLRLATEAQ